ncbi:TatD DNase family Scn1 [Fistulina hepatica ATCC 64428]|uniref:TatD DNase family Scn1 n=1 Tax=Fistulina hepatica ATCC 64428 TaxID=1128425 RepID=A0A0D7AJC6_9AGAR|nr:TatD DNase family Scn1 [Fistulina hepatica ATCC 64428]
MPSIDVLKHVVDVHCHPTDSPESVTAESMARVHITVCAMASQQSDQHLVKDMAIRFHDKVVPYFGYHPWFAHHISLSYPPPSKIEHYRKLFQPADDQSVVFSEMLDVLPEPLPLSGVISDLRKLLTAFPHAMVGEVGMDRVFRVAVNYHTTPRRLTPFTIPLDHQLAVLEAQLNLAVELSRNVSLHSVKCQQQTAQLLDRMLQNHGDHWRKISIDMHSCGWSPEMWRDVEKKHPNAFLSLSTAINARSANHKALITACSNDRLLAESDFHTIEECTERTWEMIKNIGEVKGWPIEEQWLPEVRVEDWGTVRRLEANWKAFQAGNHTVKPQKTSRTQRRRALEASWEPSSNSDEDDV